MLSQRLSLDLLGLDRDRDSESFQFARAPKPAALFKFGGVESDWQQLLSLDSKDCMTYAWGALCSVRFNDQLVIWMREVKGLCVFNVSFSFPEPLGECVVPVNEGSRVLPCYCILQWSQDARCGRSGHVKSFVQSNKTPQVFNLSDVLLLSVHDGALAVR